MKNPSKLDVFQLQSNSGGFFSVNSSFSLGYLVVTRVLKAARPSGHVLYGRIPSRKR
jgi:hypothetical protein